MSKRWKKHGITSSVTWRLSRTPKLKKLFMWYRTVTFSPSVCGEFRGALGRSRQSKLLHHRNSSLTFLVDFQYGTALHAGAICLLFQGNLWWKVLYFRSSRRVCDVRQMRGVESLGPAADTVLPCAQHRSVCYRFAPIRLAAILTEIKKTNNFHKEISYNNSLTWLKDK